MTTTQPVGGATERLRGALHAEVGKVVVGQGQTVDAVLAAMAVGGHLLLEGALPWPGSDPGLTCGCVCRLGPENLAQ